MPLTVSFKSSISPRTSTVIRLVKSPPATAFVTSAMDRTWFVKFMAIRFTLSVKPCGGLACQLRRRASRLNGTAHLPYALDIRHRRLTTHDTLRSDLQGDTSNLTGQSR